MNLRQQLAQDLGSKISECTVGRKFGHGSLEVGDKVFAFTLADESAALKLPATRIAELIQSDRGGEIHHLAMGKRIMREWVVIPAIAAAENLNLLREAKEYVASLPSEEIRKMAKKKAAKKASTR
jgi:hypothetical protein